LPAFIIKRLPLRFTYDNHYFDARYQGIPVDGYTQMIQGMLKGADIQLNTDYLEDKSQLDRLANHVLYTGTVDAYFDYALGHLAYRSLRFETEVLDEENHQGCAVINHTDAQTPYTRIIEHKHFTFGKQPKTVISREYPMNWEPGNDPYYPVNDQTNNALYSAYEKLAQKEKVLFGGRLGEYRYYDMDQVIEAALEKFRHFSKQ
jgi:UDP-galactopyranose mutase